MTARTADNDPIREPTLFSAMHHAAPLARPARASCIVMALLGGVSFVGRHGVPAGRRLAGVRLPRARRAAGLLGVPAQLPRRRGLRGGHGDAVGADACARSATAAACAEWTLNPLWAQLDRETHEEFGCSGCSWCRAAGRLPIAGFLSPQEKESFARALSARAGRGEARADADGACLMLEQKSGGRGRSRRRGLDARAT